MVLVYKECERGAMGAQLDQSLYEFALDFLLSPDITSEKVSLGMIIFGCIMIGLGYRKQNVRVN